MKTSSYISSLLLALILFCSAGSVDAFAQKGPKGSKGGDRSEKVKAMKRAFFTDELNLSSEEAEAFWPVYNEFSSKLRALRKRSKDAGSAKENMAIKEEKIALEKQYLAKYQEVLPGDKVDKLYAAEKKWKEQLLIEAKKRKER